MMRLLLLALLGLAVLGCQKAVPIQQKYSAELSQLAPGRTTISEFRDEFASAYLAGQNGSVSVFALEDVQYAPTDERADRWSGNVTRRLHFYFVDEILSRWGEPGDWEADYNVDVRVH